MRKGMIKRSCIYDIMFTAETNMDNKTVVIIAHGFGSSKESPTAQMLMKELPKHGIGAIAFDFPAHGESPVDGEFLTIDNCIDDLMDVEELVRNQNPGVDVVYFGSSFGAYITLNYIYGCRLRGARAFLRSAAVNMPDLFRNPTDEERQSLEENGYVMLDYDNGRPLKVTEEFINDLWEHDLFERFRTFGADIRMIHGSSDKTIDYARAKEFAAKNDIDMTTVDDGDHRLSIPGAPERVLSEVLEFLNV